MKKIIIIVICLFQFTTLFAQKEEVKKYLRLVAYGKIDEVKSIIPDLLAKYPNDPGVKLLHGTILDDAFLALDVYQSILKNYPESEWADHAYWRIIQFYAILGDTAKAQTELNNFISRYPTSPFISQSADIVRSSIALARKNLKNVVSLPTTQNTVDNSSILVNKDNSKNQTNNQATKLKEITIDPDRNAQTTDLSQIKPQIIPPKQNTEKALTEKTTSEKTDSKLVNKDENVKKLSNEPTFWGLQVGIYRDINAAESEKNKFLVKTSPEAGDVFYL